MMDGPMQSDQRDANAEIIERLGRIEAGVKATNGRVTALEGAVTAFDQWRASHEVESSARQQLIDDHRAAIERVQEALTAVSLACQTTPGNLRHAVAAVLDERQTTEDAAKYRALTRRFGSDPEESLSRWAGVKTGAKAIGWRVALTVVGIVATGIVMWIVALWTISVQGTP
jgi:hypothetical protein